MNDFENTVKTALNDEVDEQVGPRRTPPAFDATRSAARRSGGAAGSRWLRPLLAAAAVVAVAIGATAAVDAISNTQRVAPATPRPGPTPTPAPAQTVTPPAPSTPPPATTTSPTQSPVAPSRATSTTWTTYHNGRYGFSAQIPAELTAGPPPTDGAGLTYRSTDGHTEETVSASAAPAGATATSQGAEYATQLSRRGELTYTNVDVTAKTFTVSGYLYGGTYVEYVRGVVGSQSVYLLVWTYPTSQRSTADAWVQHSVATFQPGPL